MTRFQENFKVSSYVKGLQTTTILKFPYFRRLCFRISNVLIENPEIERQLQRKGGLGGEKAVRRPKSENRVRSVCSSLVGYSPQK